MISTPAAFREATHADRRRLLLYVLLAVGLDFLLYAVLAPELFSARFIWWTVVALAISYIFFKWYLNISGYRCSECGHEFQISLMTFFISRQSRTGKLLKCPSCGKKQWDLELRKVTGSEAG